MPPSQASSSADASSSSQSEYHPCLWAWCHRPFHTAEALSLHVLTDHVRKESWVWKSELANLQRAEEGVGESWSVGALVHGSLGSTSTPELSTLTTTQKSVTHRSRVSCSPQPPAGSTIVETIHSPKSPSRLLSVPKTVGLPSTPSIARTKSPSCTPNNLHTPTFASLSSPAYDAGPSNPAIPSLDTLLSDAVEGRQSPWRISSPSAISSRHRFLHLSHGSGDSQNSFDAVEQQLTQGQDDDLDEQFLAPDPVVQTVSPAELTAASPSHGGDSAVQLTPNRSQHLSVPASSQASFSMDVQTPSPVPPRSTLKSAPSLPSIPTQNPPIQTWYQPPRPRRRDPSKTSGKSGSSSKSSSKDSTTSSKAKKTKPPPVQTWEPPFGTPLSPQPNGAQRNVLFDNSPLTPTLHHKIGAGLVSQDALCHDAEFDAWMGSPVIESPIELQTQPPYHTQNQTQI
ncbi:hypothetical protein HGRIS_009445 [Hohenbuehelia grisea]|uniref:C2H2-type domain-containing protein n=1 Tax=Hohenbuehelia grisea TaxID=104357 RepID=A0ABR3J1K0_9AGAR